MRAWNAFLIILNRLFGTWDRTWITFGVLTGIIGSFITIYFLDYPDIPWFIVTRDIGLLAFLLITILILAYGNARKDIVHRNKLDELNGKIASHQDLQSDLRQSIAL